MITRIQITELQRIRRCYDSRCLDFTRENVCRCVVIKNACVYNTRGAVVTSYLRIRDCIVRIKREPIITELRIQTYITRRTHVSKRCIGFCPLLCRCIITYYRQCFIHGHVIYGCVKKGCVYCRYIYSRCSNHRHVDQRHVRR